MEFFDYSHFLLKENGQKVRTLKKEELESLTNNGFVFNATDYAQLNQCKIDSKTSLPEVRVMDSYQDDLLGEADLFTSSSYNRYGVCPVLKMGIPSSYIGFLRGSIRLSGEEKKIYADLITSICPTKIGSQDLATIQMGEYPQQVVDIELNEQLEKSFNGGLLSGDIVPTGKTYVANSSHSNVPEVVKCFIPEFYYQGKKYVRALNRNKEEITLTDENGETMVIKPNQPMWVKVEPVEYIISNWDSLPPSINPNGSGKNNYFTLVSKTAMVSSLPHYVTLMSSEKDTWTDTAISAYLNGRSTPLFSDFDFNFHFTGGFLGESLDMDREYEDVIVLDEGQKIINNYDFCGCVNFKSIVLRDFQTPQIHTFDDTQLKYAFKKSFNEISIVSNPNDINHSTSSVLVLPAIYENLYLHSGISINNLFYDSRLPKILDTLHRARVKIPYDFFFDMKDEDVDHFIDNSNFHFLNEVMYSCKQNASSLRPYWEAGIFFKFLQNMGCFCNDHILDKNGRPTQAILAQKASSFISAMIKEYPEICKTVMESVILYNQHPNQNFLKFLMVKGQEGKNENFALIMKFAESNVSIIHEFSKNFDDVKKFRKGLSEDGLPITIGWEEAIKNYFLNRGYGEIDERYKDIAEVFSARGLNGKVFKKAIEIRNVALNSNMPSHILGEELKETTILDSVEAIKAKTHALLQDSVSEIEKLYSQMFTFEMLDKYDPRNYIIGLFVNCCCTITSDYYGGIIAKQTGQCNDLQNMVIKNAEGEIVGKATLFVNEETGEAIFNEFDLREEYRKTNSKLALKAFLRGTRAFIEKYNELHPDNPLKRVNVGTGYNKLLSELKDFKHTRNRGFVAVPSRYEFQDARGEQVVLYNAEDGIKSLE